MDPAASTPTTDHPTEDAQFYRATLHALIEQGADLARQIHAEPTTKPTAKAQPFDKTARGVRRNIYLARLVTTPPAAANPRPRAAARQQIIRQVEDVIQRQAEPGEEAAYEAELAERLADPDLDEDLTDRPLAEIITDITRDLGLAHVPGAHHPWKRRTPTEIRYLRAQAKLRCEEDDRPLPGVQGTASPGLNATPTPPKPPAHPSQTATQQPPPSSPPPRTSATTPATHDPP